MEFCLTTPRRPPTTTKSTATASFTHNRVPQAQGHPPYSVMILQAIGELNEPQGSSKQAISKHIISMKYKLPTNHSDLLGENLKSLKNDGQLKMVKHSYKLSRPQSVVPSMGNGQNDGRTDRRKKRSWSLVQPKSDTGRILDVGETDVRCEVGHSLEIGNGICLDDHPKKKSGPLVNVQHMEIEAQPDGSLPGVIIQPTCQPTIGPYASFRSSEKYGELVMQKLEYLRKTVSDTLQDIKPHVMDKDALKKLESLETLAVVIL